MRLHRLAGPWPDGDAIQSYEPRARLAGESACLVDGIVGCGSPEVVAAAVESRHAVTVVVHLPISDELGGAHATPAVRALEAKVQAASGVLCSSRWSAAELSRRYGRSDVGVAIPGVARTRSTGQSGFGTTVHSERRSPDADQRSAHAGTCAAAGGSTDS